MERKGLLFIIAAPSGAGKTSLVRALVDSDPKLAVSVSFTTRARRPDETDGVSYHFIDEATFQDMIDKQEFLEYADVFDCHYGTGKQWVENELNRGNDIILEIDWQGAQQIRDKVDSTIDIFILPPTFQALEDRLHSRGESVDTVNRRMRDAVTELAHYYEFDYFVINDDFERALAELSAIINAKRHNSPLKPHEIDDFADQLMAQVTKIQ
jgi:guanylate kinase